MSEDEKKGIVTAATEISQKLISALPPAFLGLVVLNVIFLALVFWFLSTQIDQRTALVGKLLEHCMAQADRGDDLGAQRARLDALEHDVRALEVEERNKH